MANRGTQRRLCGFIVTAVVLVVSDFAYVFDHTWRLAVGVLLVAAFSMIILFLRSLQLERNAAHDLQRKIVNREAQSKASERRLFRAYVAALAFATKSEREKAD